MRELKFRAWSEEQAEMLEKLRERGYRAEFGVGLSKCKQIIDEYLRK